MASFIYNPARQDFMTKQIDMSSDTIKLVLVDIRAGHYSPLQSDGFLTAIAAGDRIATSGALSGITVTNGTFSAANVTLPLVPASTAQCKGVLYKDTGSAATSRLIAFLDNDRYAGLPVIPNGNDINWLWPLDVNKIFTL